MFFWGSTFSGGYVVNPPTDVSSGWLFHAGREGRLRRLVLRLSLCRGPRCAESRRVVGNMWEVHGKSPCVVKKKMYDFYQRFCWGLFLLMLLLDVVDVILVYFLVGCQTFRVLFGLLKRGPKHPEVSAEPTIVGNRW